MRVSQTGRSQDPSSGRVRRVIVTVPTKDFLESTVVLEVNDHVLTKYALIISNASCTTNCFAPLALVLHR